MANVIIKELPSDIVGHIRTFIYSEMPRQGHKKEFCNICGLSRTFRSHPPIIAVDIDNVDGVEFFTICSLNCYRRESDARARYGEPPLIVVKY